MLFRKKSEEYKSIDKDELKKIQSKYDSYENEELTKTHFVKKYGEEALTKVSVSPITHEKGEINEISK